MYERLLTLFSLFVLIIGFISLIIILNLGSVVFIGSVEELPDDTLVSFQAMVTGEHSTGEGFVLELSRTQTVSGYLDSTSNNSFENELVLVTGRNDGDWFNIYSIELV